MRAPHNEDTPRDFKISRDCRILRVQRAEIPKFYGFAGGAFQEVNMVDRLAVAFKQIRLEPKNMVLQLPGIWGARPNCVVVCINKTWVVPLSLTSCSLLQITSQYILCIWRADRHQGSACLAFFAELNAAQSVKRRQSLWLWECGQFPQIA